MAVTHTNWAISDGNFSAPNPQGSPLCVWALTSMLHYVNYVSIKWLKHLPLCLIMWLSGDVKPVAKTTREDGVSVYIVQEYFQYNPHSYYDLEAKMESCCIEQPEPGKN